MKYISQALVSQRCKEAHEANNTTALGHYAKPLRLCVKHKKKPSPALTNVITNEGCI